MSKFIQIHCDECNQNTIVAKIDKIEQTGPSSGLISSELEIERGCYHVNVDMELKPILDAWNTK